MFNPIIASIRCSRFVIHLMMFTTLSWKWWRHTCLLIIICSSISWRIILSPMRRLRIITRSVLMHRCLPSIIYSLASIFWCRSICSCLLFDWWCINETSIYRNLTTFWCQFNYCLVIICLYNSTSIPFPDTAFD